MQSSLRILFFSTALAAGLGAQTLYGAGTAGSGGVAPRIWYTGPVTAGALASIDLERAVGGMPAFLLLGWSRVDLPVFGMQLLVQPQLGLFGGFASGVAGAPAQGRLSLPLPLPNQPALIGGVFDFQWAVLDPGTVGGFAATTGLELRVAPPPLVLACGTQGMAVDSVFALDPATGAVSHWNTQLYANNPVDVQFTPDGNLCVVASELTHEFIIGDARNGGARLASITVPSSCTPNSAAITPDGRRAYGVTFGVAGSNAGRIVEFDVDPASPRFGQILAWVSGMPLINQLEGVGISGNGRVLTACNLGLGDTPMILIVDVDPQSPTFNTVRASFPAPAIVTDIRATHDATLAFACLAPITGPGSLAIIDVPAGAIAAIIPNIGMFPTDLEIDLRDQFVLVGCPNSNEVVRIGLDPADPAYMQPVAIPAPLAPFAIAIAPDGRTAWCTEQNGTMVHELDLATMAVVRSFTLGPSAYAGITVR